MAYKRPSNPWKTPQTKIAVFDGIGGPPVQILRRYSDRGSDISTTICNESVDGHLAKKGSMVLRPGMRRLGSSDDTINWIGQIKIGGLSVFGTLHQGGLDLLSLPARLKYEEIPFIEDDYPALPAGYPSTFPRPGGPNNDEPPSDPSLPIDDQACVVSYEWESTPASIAFTMPYAVTPSTPASGSFFWKNEGYRPAETLTGTYGVSPAWVTTALLSTRTFVIGRCQGVQVGGITFTPTGKDAEDNWLEPGVYTARKTLTWSDGEAMFVDLQLTVGAPAITVSPSSDDISVYVGDTGNETTIASISNTGYAGSVLEWEVGSITGDAALVAIISSDPSSGSLNKDASENATITLTTPGSLAEGEYSAVVAFRDSRLTTITSNFTVNLTVASIPLYTGRVEFIVQEDITYAYVSGNPAAVPSDTSSSQTHYSKANGPTSTDPSFWSTDNSQGGTGSLFGYDGTAQLNTPVSTSWLKWGDTGGYWSANQTTQALFRASGSPYGSWVRTITDPTVIFNGAAYYTILKTYTITVDEE